MCRVLCHGLSLNSFTQSSLHKVHQLYAYTNAGCHSLPPTGSLLVLPPPPILSPSPMLSALKLEFQHRMLPCTMHIYPLTHQAGHRR